MHLSEDECFFLRIVLVNVAAPTSFQQLRTVYGVTHIAYRCICQALKLLEDGRHRYICINDTYNTSHTNCIRALFAIVLAECSLTGFGENYESRMSKDIFWRIQSKIQIYDMDCRAKICNGT